MKILNIFLITFVFVLYGCTSNTESFSPYGNSEANLKELRVGLAPDYPPIVFKERDKLQGIEVDMAKKLAYDLNVRIDFVELPRNQLIPALTGNRIDIIMSGMSITAERQRQVAFIEPYLQVGQMALIRKNEISQFSNRRLILETSKRVGFQPDTTSEVFVKKSMPNARYVPEVSVDAAVTDLRNGKIDVFIHDAPTIWMIAGNIHEQQLMGLFWRLTDESLAWAVRPSDSVLQKQLNNIIEKWRENGVLRAILNKWIKLQIDVEG